MLKTAVMEQMVKTYSPYYYDSYPFTEVENYYTSFISIARSHFKHMDIVHLKYYSESS